MKPGGFTCCTTKGFQIRFDNGYTVSVQFGPYNYCSNLDPDRNPSKQGEICKNAEVAVLDPDGHFVRDVNGLFKSDAVEGWVKPDQLLEVMNVVAKL
jgi:hypothetical protein